MLGTQEILLILGAGVLLFGAKKIPEIARGLGRSMTEFKKGMRDDKADAESPKKEKPRPPEGAGDNASDAPGDVG